MSAKITLSCQISPELMVGVNRLGERIGFDIGNGIAVTAVQGDRIGVSLKDGSVNTVCLDGSTGKVLDFSL